MPGAKFMLFIELWHLRFAVGFEITGYVFRVTSFVDYRVLLLFGGAVFGKEQKDQRRYASTSAKLPEKNGDVANAE
jgi:hypothetical protein